MGLMSMSDDSIIAGVQQQTSGQGQEESVRVFVRIRPLNKREISENQTIGWNFNETSMLEDTQNGIRAYTVRKYIDLIMY
jgi:hypothetical protein